jgi:hypothetical protein
VVCWPPDRVISMFAHFVEDWVYGGALAAPALLIVAIGLAGPVGEPLVAVYFLLPIYMLHQLEEHAGDRFRRFVNERLGGGTELLTRLDVFLINVPGVWGLFALVFAFAATVNIGIGLIAAYTVLINAVAHLGQAVRQRSLNPGLVTAIILFLPAGLWAVLAIGRESPGWTWHLVGIASGLLIHALIVARVASRMRRAHAAAA